MFEHELEDLFRLEREGRMDSGDRPAPGPIEDLRTIEKGSRRRAVRAVRMNACGGRRVEIR